MSTLLKAVPNAAKGDLPETHISVRGVDKVYKSPRGPVPALQDISLDIKKGEFVSILGPSGCGKSTLLKCMTGLENISQGAIQVAGKALNGRPPEETAMVFQKDVLLDWRTILDNVMITAEFSRQNTPAMKARALKLLERFGLLGFEDRHPWELSGGMRQRASICRALLCDPSLLMMDEPFGALDAMTRDDLNLELARIWQDTRKTIVFVTHGISEAVFLSDRVVIMDRNPGRIVEIVDIDLPRPRELSVRETKDFAHYYSHIRHVFATLGILKE
ncbi:ABC transporter ATP-binding protein [Bordetella genomosp. 10]|uniref:ABC transporter ATP-binding protein n=1 Tax=Bordetella genomosp. 10 TaxID=1416804 RepID=A0A261S1D5_9BORD|nr:ABC transporter ATP-binding protein [Bordetella genomosp. 10]OZI31149.1 ABC transporter ATP-binding protein [Bordetella genomosp. 10]